MNQAKKVDIGHLNIRLRGLPPQAATGLAEGLGPEILAQLAGQRLPEGRAAEVDAGRLEAGAAAADALRLAIARRIALALAARNGSGEV